MQGQRVNNFRIVRLLGEGGMGTVYEAEHTLIHRKVAVKVLKPNLSVNSLVVQRFFNEARATSAIRHPNIVEVVDVGLLDDGVPYLVMELLQGESLGARLDRLGALDLEPALDIIGQAASALEAAHANGIVHRDLKPDNLFLARDPYEAEREFVKVLDFGVAKLRPDIAAAPVKTMAGALFGTPTYMSPEQCRGLSDELDQRADIYALGVILYECLCGRPPFLADNLGDMISDHMHSPPPPPANYSPNLPAPIQDVILKALAKNPDDRFATMAELSAALGRPITRLSVPAHASSRLARSTAASSVPPATEPKRSSPSPRPLSPALSQRESAVSAEARAVRRTRLLRRALLTAGALSAALVVAYVVGRQAPPREPASSPVAVGASRHEHVQVSAPETTSTSPAAGVTPPERVPAGVLPPTEPARSAGAQRGERASSHRHGSRETKAPAAAAQTQEGGPSVTAKAPNSEATALPDHAGVASSSAAPGYLSLDSEPWSEVFLGAEFLGTTPPMRVPLPPGKHVLTLKNSELGKSTSYAVEIKSGGNVSRLVGWEQ